MPNEEADDKKNEKTNGEHEKRRTEENAADEDGEAKTKKLPEPPGNLRRRAEWFKKRH